MIYDSSNAFSTAISYHWNQNYQNHAIFGKRTIMHNKDTGLAGFNGLFVDGHVKYYDYMEAGGIDMWENSKP